MFFSVRDGYCPERFALSAWLAARGTGSSGQSALSLAGAQLRHIAGTGVRIAYLLILQQDWILRWLACQSILPIKARSRETLECCGHNDRSTKGEI
jgi:hypothetical protein